jgi:homoserine O-acetyltransferase
VKDPSPGWWEFMIGPGHPIDTSQYFVICVNSLGSCFGSTGPSSIDPATGCPYRLTFPDLTVDDIAASAKLLLNELGIQQLHTLVGPSMGGMSALALLRREPEIASNLILISSAAHATPFAIAMRSLQRDIITSDPKWQQGEYSYQDPPANGVRMARKLGLTTYRSPEEWLVRFGRKKSRNIQNKPFVSEFEIESYLDYNAAKFVGSFDPNCYLYLSRAMDWFDMKENGANLHQALTPIQLDNALVIGVQSDFLIPEWQQKELAVALNEAGTRVEYVALESVQGHDAFLVDEERFAPVVRQHMAKLSTAETA